MWRGTLNIPTNTGSSSDFSSSSTSSSKLSLNPSKFTFLDITVNIQMSINPYNVLVVLDLQSVVIKENTTKKAIHHAQGKLYIKDSIFQKISVLVDVKLQMLFHGTCHRILRAIKLTIVGF